MPGKEEYREAAKTSPDSRTPAQQALVDKAHQNGMTDIKNLDHEARRVARYG